MIRSTTSAALLSAIAFWIAASPARVQGAPCEPSFRAIHDFKVGDVFQYRIWRRTGDPGMLLARGTETIRQYVIASRRDSAESVTYGISGLARASEMENGRVLSSSTAPFSETLRFVDSAGHRLNRCHGDIVPFPELSQDPRVRTRLRAVPADTQRFRLARPGETIKILGEEVGTLVGDTALAPIMDALFSLAYAEGLGLLERIEGGGPMLQVGYSETLTGFIRDGKVHGVLAPDLAVTLAIRSEADRARPAPGAMSWPFRQGDAAFDLRGRRVRQSGLPWR